MAESRSGAMDDKEKVRINMMAIIVARMKGIRWCQLYNWMRGLCILVKLTILYGHHYSTFI